ncbi:MAG: hypothetical protein ACRDH7_04370 [Actinomycetota bacterium]
MPRDRMYVRRFLNEPDHHGGAYLLMSVPDSEGARGSYVESSVRFEIADCARNVQVEFPLHDAAARRNSLRKARLLSSVLRDFERALSAEAKVAAARERDRRSLRASSPEATEWMVHVVADVSEPDAIGDAALEELMKRLEHASASVGMASRDLSVTLTVEALCSADATRIGTWMVRAAAAGLDALSNVRAAVESVDD